MATHKWKLRLEMEVDQEPDGKEMTVIEMTGTQATDGGTRAVNECLAIEMASLCEMLLASGRIVCGSDLQGSIDAFSGR